MQTEAYGGQCIHSLGSCTVYLHIDNKVFPTICEVTDTPGPIILGRIEAKQMGYVQYPQIKAPKHTKSAKETIHKVSVSTQSVIAQSTTQSKQIKQTNEPKLSKIKWNKNQLN